MNDLIDRAEAQTELQLVARRYTVAHEAHGEGKVVWSDNLISVTDAMNALREMPSAQSERKKGYWVSQKGGGYRCSECGRYALDEVDGNFIHVAFESNFCPYCGADMRGEEDD